VGAGRQRKMEGWRERYVCFAKVKGVERGSETRSTYHFRRLLKGRLYRRLRSCGDRRGYQRYRLALGVTSWTKWYLS